MSDSDEQRRSQRYNATLRLAFEYAGRSQVAITTNVSPQGANIVAPVPLPQGAIVVFEVADTSLNDTGQNDIVKLIAQVAWSAPAPFGSGDSYSAGLELMRASASSWSTLIAFLRDQLRANPRTDTPRRMGSSPSFDLRKKTEDDADTKKLFEVLYHTDGIWFRGHLVYASESTLWIATAAAPPKLDADLSVRIGMRTEAGPSALVVSGRVPGAPLPDNQRKGWIFECEITEAQPPVLFTELLRTVDDTRFIA